MNLESQTPVSANKVEGSAVAPRNRVLPRATPESLALIKRNVPPELRALSAWVVGDRSPKTMKDGSVKSSKAPIDPKNGRAAKSNDPSTWGSFDQAIARAETEDRAFGIGVNLLGSDLLGLDLDDVIDIETGAFNARAAELLGALPRSYCERSPSGRGVRQFYRGRKPAGIKRSVIKDAFGPGADLEVYDGEGGGRYLTVTGDIIGTAPLPIAEASDEDLAALVAFCDSSRRAPKQQHASKQETEPPRGSALAASSSDVIRTNSNREHDLARATWGLAEERLLDPDAGYNAWLRVGASLVELGDDGLNLWIEYSRRSKDFDENEIRSKWQGMRGSSIASLFGMFDDADPTWRARCPIVLGEGVGSSASPDSCEGETLSLISEGPEEEPLHELADKLANYVFGVLRKTMTRIVQLSKTAKPDGLSKAAYDLGRFVGAGLLSRSDAIGNLKATAKQAGLDESTAEQLIQVGLATGIGRPHSAEALDARLSKRSAGSPTPTSRAPHDQVDDERPTIVIEEGIVDKLVDRAEEALMKGAPLEIFQRGSILVRPIRIVEPSARAALTRASGSLVIHAVDVPYMLDTFTRVAKWTRPKKHGNVVLFVSADVPSNIPKIYIARAGRWHVKHLLSIAECPTLRPDGSILASEGYDPDTRLIVDLRGCSFPAVPAQPTHEDALRALDVLGDILKDFPFVAASDRATALAAILTAVIRPSLPTAPMFVFRAPKMASGKSLLVDVVAMIATGHCASMMSQGKDSDELRKRMFSLLLEGEPIACIDNVERPLGGAEICTALTQEKFKDRVLGQSKTATVPTTATTWFATGNALTIEGDLSSRVLPCDLDAGCERPEERSFDRNLREYIPANRGILVVAALTVLRAYHVAGRPRQSLPVFGRFEGWSDWVRSALVWLGQADPCEGRRRLEQLDPIRTSLIAVLVPWRELVGDKALTAKQIIDIAKQPTSGDSGAALHDALLDVAEDQRGGQVNARRLGRWIAKYVGRIEGGHCIESAGGRSGSALWRVRAVDPERADVGLVGFEGSFQPMHARKVDSDTHVRTRAHARAHGGPGETNSYYPPNPRVTADDEALAAEIRAVLQSEPAADCGGRA